MELRENNAKIIVISGKARSGKDTTMGYLKEYYEGLGKKVINLQFASTLKEYAKQISNWDGSDETKPRKLLQELGTDIIRERLDEYFFIKRMIQDIEVYSYFFDVIIISDARFKIEIESIKNKFDDVISINLIRPLYESELTGSEKVHATEMGLEGYNNFDYEIVNDGSLNDLERKAIDLASII